MEKTIYQSPDVRFVTVWQCQDILTVSNDFEVDDFVDEGDLF